MASTELSLECKVQSYSMLLKYSFGDHGQLQPPAAAADQSYNKLRDFVSRLEEERLKIDVFKRELPLCMQLLTNAVETSRRQLQACKTTIQSPTPKPVFEEFMPLKNSTPAGEDQNPVTISDKANWMTSVQLWSQASDATKHQSSTPNESPSKQDSNNSETCSHRAINNNGAFVPYSGPRAAEKVPETELLKKAPSNCGNNNTTEGGRVEQRDEVGLLTQSTPSSNANSTSQTHRKARRCWSPDLHRRFVNALHMLGGSQVATPKQIRELMKVDGLTNDEVKSHLQKYRLHTRRPGPTPQVASGPPPPQLVLLGLGGLWVPPEYAAAQSGAPALYGPMTTSHQPSHFYTPPALPQEFYTRTPPPHHLQHPSLQHHQVQLYKAATPQTAQSSPDSEARGTGERSSKSFEEEKSGSSSGRIEGGENGDDRIKERRSRSEEGGESIGSEITLKF